LGLLVASVYAFFWWWAIGATLLSVTLLAAAVVAARSEGPRARPRSGHRQADPEAPL
jgi:heme exporter protein D